RRMAQDRNPRPSGSSGRQMPVQQRRALRYLSGSARGSLPEIRLRVAGTSQPAAGVDAAGQEQDDIAYREFFLARYSRRRGGARRNGSGRDGAGVADRVL